MAAAVEERPVYQVRFPDARRAVRRNPPLQNKYFATDLAVERFLLELSEYCQSLVSDNRSHFGWLLQFRGDFRSIMRYRPCAGLREFLGVCPPEHPSFLIGVWLLGRCAARQATFDLERLPADGTSRARKHFARALRRIESWPRLRRLAADFPNDANVAAAMSRTAGESFRRRLSRFAQHVDRLHESEAAVASRMPLWFRDFEWQRTEPKRPAWIRIVLERIRQWMRGV